MNAGADAKSVGPRGGTGINRLMGDPIKRGEPTGGHRLGGSIGTQAVGERIPGPLSHKGWLALVNGAKGQRPCVWDQG